MGWADEWVWRARGVLRVSALGKIVTRSEATGWGRADPSHRGNLDLPPVLPFLGRTQLQILSFLTSAILMSAHFFTSWAVNERVLLRDE